MNEPDKENFLTGRFENCITSRNKNFGKKNNFNRQGKSKNL